MAMNPSDLKQARGSPRHPNAMSTLLGTYLLVIGFLLITSVYLDRVGNRLQLPGVLLVLLLGLLTHNEVQRVGGQTPASAQPGPGRRFGAGGGGGCAVSGRHQHQLGNRCAAWRVQGCVWRCWAPRSRPCC